MWWNRKLRHKFALPAVAALIFASLALTPPVAFACGWWGDGEDEGEDDVILVIPDNASSAASEPTDPKEMARLSSAYRQGDGVPRNPIFARKWARKAAEAGHVGAMNDLAQMLETAFGGPKDEAGAARWYARAAEHGIAEAQHSLSMILRNGRGVARDPLAAEKWLRRAAGQGHAAAAADLAEWIWAGSVVARSPEEGCFWWFVALGQGYEGTAERCRQIRPALSDQTLRAVQVRAEAWVPSREDKITVLRGGES
jgi:TPR repeat protein